MLSDVPLFPLNTVLFPHGKISLRIFEPRYLRMVSDCMKSNKPFAVILIRQGREAGIAASFHSIGTLANITDFDRLEDGLLGISCQGLKKVCVINHRTQSDQLIIGQVNDKFEEEENLDWGFLSKKYQGIINYLKQTLTADQIEDQEQTRADEWQDLDWMSFQVIASLPLALSSQQRLLEMNISERLHNLKDVLEKNDLL